jgi:hypothetical protein
MNSTNKPQSTLMAMSQLGTKGSPAPGMSQGPGGGATTPMQSGLDSHLNFGMGHGHNFFSTTPLMGHAMSGTPLGGQNHFAEGGKVKKPAGPSAKERKAIRALIERGKEHAVAALRRSRDELLDMSPTPNTKDFTDTDFTEPLARLQSRLTMADGGEVEAPAAQAGNPAAMYQEYMDLMAQLESSDLDGQSQMQIIDRLALIEGQLEGLGIDVSGAASAPPE